MTLYCIKPTPTQKQQGQTPEYTYKLPPGTRRCLEQVLRTREVLVGYAPDGREIVREPSVR